MDDKAGVLVLGAGHLCADGLLAELETVLLEAVDSAGLAPADAAAFSRLSGVACRFAQQAPLPGSYYITCILEHKKFLQKFPPNFLRPFYAHRTKPRYNVAARSLV